MRLAAGAFSILLLGASIARGAGAAEPIELPEGEPYLHPSSGLRFPADVGTFTRVSAYRYDTPKYMHEGNWRLGVLIDDSASEEQAEKLGAVFSGALGGPMAALSGLVSEQLGVERVPLEFTSNNGQHRLKVGDKERDVVSEAYLLRLGDNFVKFRVTCPKEKYEPAEERVERFFQSLKLPAPPAPHGGAGVPAGAGGTPAPQS